MKTPLLGINIDHIATLRQLRGTAYPDIVEAAKLAVSAGADQITVHLREDRRHIHDEDVRRLLPVLRELAVPLNLEMAVSEAIIRFALKTKPDWACLVPEKRKEVTTEGGLDVVKNRSRVQKAIAQLKKAGIRVSCFVEPTLAVIRVCKEIGADAVELHTGRYCLAAQSGKAVRARSELERIQKSAHLGHKLGLQVHAGHGFDYENVRPVAALEMLDRSPLIEEYNIGHAVVCRAALVGLERAVREMVSAIRAP